MMQRRIAFYGKGGIGKTTLAANTAAELARTGKKVLFIGCDPKADSCMSLVGKRIPSVLEQSSILGTALLEEDIMFQGCYGISCIEAGGPEAGLGCAGMGFNIMMSELERLEILKRDWDYIIYDVLGDVVCSGFSVPMRSKYADKIYLVSTSAYMSIYAANNIVRSAVKLSEGSSNIVGGLILNRYRDEKDTELIDIYCERTGLKCISVIDEDDIWGITECGGKTVPEEYPESKAAKQLTKMTEEIDKDIDYGKPNPLSIEEMDGFRRLLWERHAK